VGLGKIAISKSSRTTFYTLPVSKV